MIKLINIYVIVTTLVLASDNGFAATVTGFNDGTISGSGFGTTAPTHFFETFENGTDGAVIADTEPGVNYWRDYSSIEAYGSLPPEYSSDQPRQNSQLCSKHYYVIPPDVVGLDYANSRLYYDWPSQIGDGGKFFVSFRVWWDWGAPGDDSWQWKLFRAVHGPDYQDMPGIMTNCFVKPGSELEDTYNTTILLDTSSTQSNPEDLKVVTDNSPTGLYAWGQFQLWWSGDDTSGEVHVRFLNPTTGLVVERDYVGATLTESWIQTFIFGFSFDNVEDPDGVTATNYLDDIYISDSWLRVIIGDQPTFSACSTQEMQPIVSVSGTEIIISTNQGAIPNGTAYLYVIDGTGVVSSGYPITIGGTSSENPIVEILTASGQTTTASVFEITGTATADTGLTISGVTCPGQTVTADDGTFDELSESWTCQAALSVGSNNLTFTGTDSISNTGTDSITVTRTETPTSHSLGKGFYSNGINFK